MELQHLHNTDRTDEPQRDAAQTSTPMVRELTPRDLDEQRRLVRASLLATR